MRVAGLKPSDFEVLDNGVPQQVDLVSFEQIPLNVVLALDMSESVSGDRLDQLREASAESAGVAHERRSGGARDLHRACRARVEAHQGSGASAPAMAPLNERG